MSACARIIAGTMLAAMASPSFAAALLHPLFSDHVVLQRDQSIKLWGAAKPGDRITVELGGSRAENVVAADGRWIVSLPAMSAGGPHSLIARSASGADQRIDDVLIGDVWLCSGQSNMVLQVHRALDARAEIANAKSDSIRLLTVPLASSARAQSQFSAPVEWQRVSSTTIPEFSAACYYFARELQKTVNVPMGLIAAAWGGSKIETWMSASALRADGGRDLDLDILEESTQDPWRASARWGERWEKWWRAQKGVDATPPWSIQAIGEWRTVPGTFGPWEEWGDPRLAAYNGMLWYRTKVSLSAALAAQSATLSLGQVDEVDQTWVNGYPIGARANAKVAAEERALPLNGTGGERTYRLPLGTLVSGENVIVVNVLDTYASGGLRGPANSLSLRFADGTSVALDRDWHYQLPPANIGAPPRAPWESVAGLGVIFNGMIAPLSPLGLRGVVWYQGESNTEAPAEYGGLLRSLMADWRARFGERLPFLIVQLANYGVPPTQPTASGWAELREQQRRTVAGDSRTGLAIAIDIGDRYDIHPSNKQELGRRLARAARRVVFGDNIAPSGPRIVEARAAGARVVVSFADVSGQLIALNADHAIGFELCAADQASCRFVSARPSGTRVEIDAAQVPSATRVRYCWADGPVCTLYDEARLPVGPFEIEVQR